MKKLTHKNSEQEDVNWKIATCLKQSKNLREFLTTTIDKLSVMDKKFYQYIGEILKIIGLNAIVTREGDVNCRFDATIKDDKTSIPIEIKSPKEDSQINIKSIRQAFENKVVILSRKFYPTDMDITSLAIALNYPPVRSDVYELIEDIYKAWQVNIGIINLEDLLRLAYEIGKNGKTLNMEYFNHLKGKFDYEEAFVKE